MPDQASPWGGWEVRVNLVCTLCARTVGRARGPNARPVTLTSVRVLDASHAEAVRRLRCPYCLGRLWLQDREVIYVDRPALSGEDLRTRRGRPQKVSRAS
jgi:DNA-directed RNA polymerase subunit RPC12/RpoP